MKVAVVGVGNCTSSLVQAVEASKAGVLPLTGISHPCIGPYRIKDIEFCAAFDIDERKVGKPFHKAIFAEPNCTTKYFVPASSELLVSLGRLEDSVSTKMGEIFKVSAGAATQTESNILTILKSSGAEVVISYLPVGSQLATEVYARASALAGAAFINCTPANIANNSVFQRMFEEVRLPLLGDDIKSHLGSTAVHRALLDLIRKKGLTVSNTYQLNIGGNTDFLNMREPSRGSHKKITKEASLNGLLSESVGLGVGPSDYIPHLKDHKVGFIQIEGEGFLGMKFSIDLKLMVEDSPNSAGVALNAIRVAKLAMDRKIKGVINEVCPWFFKHPPRPLGEDKLFSSFDEFVKSES